MRGSPCIGPTAAGASAPSSPGTAASIPARCSIRSPPASPRISASSSACSRARRRSLTVLGAPDLIVLTLSEFAGQAYRINRAGNLPLMVDADHGYGNALNAKRTVEELETAGVCGLSLEDTDLPTPHGTTSRASPRSPRASAKMKAAPGRRARTRRCASPAAPAPSRSAGSTTRSPAARPTRRRASTRCSSSASDTRAELDAISAATKLPLIMGGGRPRARRPRLSRRAPGADGAAGPPAVRRRGQGRPRHAEGAARRHAARQAHRRGRRRS